MLIAVYLTIPRPKKLKEKTQDPLYSRYQEETKREEEKIEKKREILMRGKSITEMEGSNRNPITISFKEISLKIPLTKMMGFKKIGEKTILDSISGYASPGQVLAIMGTSGRERRRGEGRGREKERGRGGGVMHLLKEGGNAGK